MSPAQAWRKLGLEPGSDRRAVRRAYADKLRALDVDADPDGFAALREARDLALRLAERPTEPPPASLEEAAANEPSPSPAAGLTAPILALDASSDDRLTVRVEQAPSDYVRAVLDIGPSGELDSEAIADAGAPFAAPLLERTVEGAVHAHAEKSARAAHAAMDTHYAAIHELLLPEDVEEPGALDDREKVRLQAHVSAVLADPRLAEIAFYADAEAWFARVLAHSSPRSDPILVRVIDFFGWMSGAGKIGQTPEVAFLTRRRGSIDFYNAVREPKHPLFKAWRELTKPSDENSRRTPGVKRKDIATLLNAIRRDHPDLEPMLDWHRVELWENPASTASAGPRIWPWLVGVFMVLRLFMYLAQDDHRVPPTTLIPQPPSLSRDASSEINQALQGTTDGTVDWGTLSKKNPTLAALLKSQFETSKKAGEKPYLFVLQSTGFLTARALASERVAPYDLAAEHQRIILERAADMKRRDPKLCADFLGPSPSPQDQWPDALLKREFALRGKLLLQVNPKGPAPKGLSYFRVPGQVVTAAAERAHMSRNQFSAAIHGDAAPTDRCTARMALIEQALASPPETGLPLLRKM